MATMSDYSIQRISEACQIAHERLCEADCLKDRYQRSGLLAGALTSLLVTVETHLVGVKLAAAVVVDRHQAAG